MTRSSLRTICLLGALLVASSVAAPAAAQGRGGSFSFVDGVTVGGGISFYQGDLDANPNNNYLKFLGSSRASLFARADNRSGRYTVGLELGYDRIGGERQFGSRPPFSFSTNALSLSAVGSVDLGLFGEAGLVRAFGGVGPTLFLNSEYSGFQEVEAAGGFGEEEDFQDLSTRVEANLLFGLNIQDAVRIGAKVFATDYVDGFNGRGSPTDFLVFVNVGYRFDLGD